jgi:hypothetical protein
MVVGNFLYNSYDRPLPTKVDMCNNTSANGFLGNVSFSDDIFNDHTSTTFADVTTDSFYGTETLTATSAVLLVV